MAYEQLSETDKVLTAIRFVSRGLTLPEELAEFLRTEGLYELITAPQENADAASNRQTA